MKNNSPANPKTPNITVLIHLLSVSVVKLWPFMLVSFFTVLPLLSVTKIAKRRKKKYKKNERYISIFLKRSTNPDDHFKQIIAAILRVQA